MNPITNLQIALSDIFAPIIARCVEDAFRDLKTPPLPLPERPEYGTPEEVCNHFRIPLGTFRSRYAKQISHTKRGKRTYYKFADVEMFMNEGKVKTEAEVEAEAKAYIETRKQNRR